MVHEQNKGSPQNLNSRPRLASSQARGVLVTRNHLADLHPKRLSSLNGKSMTGHWTIGKRPWREKPRLVFIAKKKLVEYEGGAAQLYSPRYASPALVDAWLQDSQLGRSLTGLLVVSFQLAVDFSLSWWKVSYLKVSFAV